MSTESKEKKLMRGNFAPAKEVKVPEVESTLEDQFEREALKRLGGSVAFVARRKVVWDMDTATANSTSAEKEKK